MTLQQDADSVEELMLSKGTQRRRRPAGELCGP
jgi:hypothetical protein